MNVELTKIGKLWAEWFAVKARRDSLSLNHVDYCAWEGICNILQARIHDVSCYDKVEKLKINSN